MATLERDSVARPIDLLHVFRTVCGTCYVNHATVVRTRKLIQQYNTWRNIVAVRIGSFRKLGTQSWMVTGARSFARELNVCAANSNRWFACCVSNRIPSLSVRHSHGRLRSLRLAHSVQCA